MMLFGKIGVTLLSVLSAFLTAGHVFMDFRENPAYVEDLTFLEFLSRILYLMLFYEEKNNFNCRSNPQCKSGPCSF